MRRLLIVLSFFSSAAFAQSDLEQEMASLRNLVESQNRLIVEQSAQLQQLATRVTELEGNETGGDTNSGNLGAMEMESVLQQRSVAAPDRTVAVDADEIAQQHRQSVKTGRESVIVEDAVALSDTVDLYGSMRLFAETGGDDTTLNDGTSRLGFRMGREFSDGRTLFGRIEWKTNLVDNNSQFVVGDGPTGGITIREEQGDDVLTSRLGYIGMRFERTGELTFGKQWGVYYDVAGWTDMFNVYGGSALSVYAAGSDGGGLGSGRADNAIVWRNARGKISYGLQTQLQSSDDGEDYKSLGGSLIFAPNNSWQIGAAFVASRIKGAFEDLSGDDESGVATVGVRYHSGRWHTAFNVAAWEDHEVIFFADDTLFYDGVGAELYVDYEYSDRLHFYGGFNYTDPDIDDPRVDPDFGIEQLLLGVSWFTTDESFGYLEALVSGDTGVDGRSRDSVLAAGYRYDF